jgi:endonuclease/exonuclease/phosphatase family metal-dependent hydrolase
MQIRVGTYNAHDCIGRDGKYAPERIAAVINELDASIIALQEITLDHAGELIARLETATAMQAIDGTLHARGIGRYGNLVLSRHKVVAQRLHDLSVDGREPRGAVDLVFQVADCRVRVGATHLGLAKLERKSQIIQLARLFSAEQQAKVLLGDFNVWRTGQELAPLSRLGFRQIKVRSFPTWRMPLLALDRILAGSPALLQRCWRHDSRLARSASDHFPLLAEIQLAEATDPRVQPARKGGPIDG